jgi:hypothetical protein
MPLMHKVCTTEVNPATGACPERGVLELPGAYRVLSGMHSVGDPTLELLRNPMSGTEAAEQLRTPDA